MVYGYMTSEKNMQQLKESGVSKQNIYVIRKELFNVVKQGDIIVFKNIDELGKDFEEMKNNFNFLMKRGAILQFLEQPLLNTRGKNEETLKAMSFLLEYFVEKHKKGIKRIRGRKSLYTTLIPEQKKILENFYNKKISLKEAIHLTGFSRATVYKLRKLLFSSNKNDLKTEIYSWTIEN